jgi:class 3 adenylate cyclase
MIAFHLACKVTYLGEGDLHDFNYCDTRKKIPFCVYKYENTSKLPGHCEYSFNIYVSSDFDQKYHTKTPMMFSIVVASSFLFMALSFFVYDWFVRRRNDIVVDAARRSTAIVSSLFPSNVRDRLLADQDESINKSIAGRKFTRRNSRNSIDTNNSNFTNDHDNLDDDDDIFSRKTKPIADLFPETTILFADIAGFTAWSSTRQPCDVFSLLETIYNSFDAIAKRLDVYKVETIGDCYVAVAGLPNPRNDHAVVMTQFARLCMRKMHTLVRKLEIWLGPDTTDLAMRFGLHSGPVTAGVLRGERSRFQLFGDTMNTASRMESTGIRDCIQVSQETADLLVAAGKGNWLKAREEKVVAKGKGELQTYWVMVEPRGSSSGQQSNANESKTDDLVVSPAPATWMGKDARTERLVQWHVESLLGMIATIVESRGKENSREARIEAIATGQGWIPRNTFPSEEVQEIVQLPRYRTSHGSRSKNESDRWQLLVPQIEAQLHKFISIIATMYRGK